MLIERILMLSNTHEKSIKCEATWVLTNAITCSDETMRGLFFKSLNCDLINMLVTRLRELPDLDELKLVFEVLQSLDLLM